MSSATAVGSLKDKGFDALKQTWEEYTDAWKVFPVVESFIRLDLNRVDTSASQVLIDMISARSDCVYSLQTVLGPECVANNHINSLTGKHFPFESKWMFMFALSELFVVTSNYESYGKGELECPNYRAHIVVSEFLIDKENNEDKHSRLVNVFLGFARLSESERADKISAINKTTANIVAPIAIEVFGKMFVPSPKKKIRKEKTLFRKVIEKTPVLGILFKPVFRFNDICELGRARQERMVQQ